MGKLLNGSCKLCNLIKTEEELWLDVHRKVLEQAVPRSTVRDWLNQRIEILNASRPDDDQLPVFNSTNFFYHFQKHITIASEIDEALKTGFGLGWTKNRVGNLFLGEVKGPVDEYLQMRALIQAVERKLSEFDDRCKAKKKPPTLSEISTFQKLVEGLIKLRREAAQTQASGKIAGEALKYSIELMVRIVMDKTLGAANELKSQLTREMPGSNLPGQLADLLTHRISEGVKNVVPDILREVESKFKIK